MAQDLQGAVATREPRPLEEERQRRRSVIAASRTSSFFEFRTVWKTQYAADKLGQGSVTHRATDEATDEAPEEGLPTTPETPLPRCCRVMSHSLAQQRQPRSVSFVSSAEAEVPMILPEHLLGVRHVPRTRQQKAAAPATLLSTELRAQANLARLADNQQQLGKAVGRAVQVLSNCFVGLHLLRR